MRISSHEQSRPAPGRIAAERGSGTRDRAYGALLGLAIGDALGMPTQCLSRETRASRYGVLDGFLAAGAVSGAVSGATAFPVAIADQRAAANPDLHLSDLADRLLGLRGGTDARPDSGGTPPEPGRG